MFVVEVSVLTEDVSAVVDAVRTLTDEVRPDVVVVRFEVVVLSDAIELTPLAHSVVDAVSGIEYPDVRDVIPVPLLYVRPVAVVENIPRTVDVETEFATIAWIVEVASPI